MVRDDHLVHLLELVDADEPLDLGRDPELFLDLAQHPLLRGLLRLEEPRDQAEPRLGPAHITDEDHLIASLDDRGDDRRGVIIMHEAAALIRASDARGLVEGLLDQLGGAFGTVDELHRWEPLGDVSGARQRASPTSTPRDPGTGCGGHKAARAGVISTTTRARIARTPTSTLPKTTARDRWKMFHVKHLPSISPPLQSRAPQFENARAPRRRGALR